MRVSTTSIIAGAISFAAVVGSSPVHLKDVYVDDEGTILHTRHTTSNDVFVDTSRVNVKARAVGGYEAHIIDMPIDHFPHSERYRGLHTNATFKQRYYFDSSYYKPGGPVFLYISGETSGPSRFRNLETGIIQILMQATNGLGVILENRYYGKSYPFENSTLDNLVFLTTEQTIADNAYFAKHAVFPGVKGDLTAPNTPWILYGGSLAGGQTAFSMRTYPDILFGGLASSAVTKPQIVYPDFYKPILEKAPQDCVTSIINIVDKIDHLVASDNKRAIEKLKAIFGLKKIKDIRDFAQTIAYPIGNPMNYPTNTWQELNWNPMYGSNDFFDFCSNVTNIDAPAHITSVDTALAEHTNGEAWVNLGNYADYIKKALLPLCPSGDYDSAQCFGTQNATFWADTTNSGGRSYMYSTCTEQGAWIGAPKTGPSLISRVLQADYTQQWCQWSFPHGSGKHNIPSLPHLSHYEKYGGFDYDDVDRLAFIDGDIDPWLNFCAHSSDNTRHNIQSSDLHPRYLIAAGGHHWDSYGIKDVDAEPQFIREVHKWEIKTVKKWLRGFEAWRESVVSTEREL